MKKSSYTLFEKDLIEAQQRFPSLHIVNLEKQKILRGSFKVIDENGKFWNSYKIEIKHTNGFPYRFPIVSEIGGQIPRLEDWHIYENSGNCCITIPAKEIILCRKGITVANFIQNHVRPYFFNQAHRKHLGIYANGEYAHGVAGKWQYYFEAFGTENKELIINNFKIFLHNNEKIHKKSKCICGSGHRFRRCHQDIYWLLKNAPKNFIKLELEQLERSTSFKIPNV
ncbi:MAG: hypothetical protein AAFO07_09525 [Bacteroidota bacterium]